MVTYSIKDLVNNEVLILVPPVILDCLHTNEDFLESIYYDEEREPLSFYFVTTWLGCQLKQQDELIYSLGTCDLWACCECGQSLTFHHALIAIYEQYH